MRYYVDMHCAWEFSPTPISEDTDEPAIAAVEIPDESMRKYKRAKRRWEKAQLQLAEHQRQGAAQWKKHTEETGKQW